MQLSIGKKRIKAKVAAPEGQGEADTRFLTALMLRGGKQLLRDGAPQTLGYQLQSLRSTMALVDAFTTLVLIGDTTLLHEGAVPSNRRFQAWYAKIYSGFLSVLHDAKAPLLHGMICKS